MKFLNVNFEYCNGIKKLVNTFDFSETKAIAIYAPNGVMKSSFAKTFSEFHAGTNSIDRVSPERTSKREIRDETSKELDKDGIFVINTHEKNYDHSGNTSILLQNETLKKEYVNLISDTEAAKKYLLNELKKISHSKLDLEREFSLSFTGKENNFYAAIISIKDEVEALEGSAFSDVYYDQIFQEPIVNFLNEREVKNAIGDYVTKYNELISKSFYFQKDFNLYNAETVSKSMVKNGFFKAKHSVVLNGEQPKVINSKDELEELIESEKKKILSNPALQTKFDEINEKINKNDGLRGFGSYISATPKVLPQLNDLESFKKIVLKSYLKKCFDLFTDLIQKYQSAEIRLREIEKKAEEEKTQWEKVIEIFNQRFHVPFDLEAKNKIGVMLANEAVPKLAFTFDNGEKQVPIKQETLNEVLSRGEEKALYILKIIFEIEARKVTKKKTLFIIDDVADSFDYKNKYAIIEYLKELLEVDHFYQIVLTHNFDFFRTILIRYVGYSNCFMAFKSSDGITLQMAKGVKNVFVNDWKKNFFSDPKKRIASISFIRNIIEYTKGTDNSEYLKLTSLLHRKNASDKIVQADLDETFKTVFGESGTYPNPKEPVMEMIHAEAENCLSSSEGVNFENKIVLSISIRLMAEDFMKSKIKDPRFFSDIETKDRQTFRLFEQFTKTFPNDLKSIQILDRVMIMTPEIIHVNSFMYEPILDMSDQNLKDLHADVKKLT